LASFEGDTVSAVEGEVNCGDRGDIRMMGMVLSRGELLNGGLRGADKACVINEMLGRPVDGGGGGRAASRDDDERPVDGGGGGRATTSVRWMVAAEDVIDYYRPWWSKMKMNGRLTAPRRCKDGRCRRRRARN